MYLLFVDESGTHGGSHSFVLGGLAIHEQDTEELAHRLDRVVEQSPAPLPLPASEMELHVAELRNAKKPVASARGPVSPWSSVPRPARTALLDVAYQVLGDFRSRDPLLPVVLFGVVIDARFRSEQSARERERFAYEVLLHKFDVMLKRVRRSEGLNNRGLVIHDRRVVAERDIQEWTREWRRAAGTIGRLQNLADVPLFADSKASRLLQAADLIAYSLYRHYDPQRRGTDFASALWERFDIVDDALHGCVHFTPSFGAGSCVCPPCTRRLVAEATRRTVRQTAGTGH